MSSRNYPALQKNDFEKVVSKYTDHLDEAGDNVKAEATSSQHQQDDGGQGKAAHVSDS